MVLDREQELVMDMEHCSVLGFVQRRKPPPSLRPPPGAGSIHLPDEFSTTGLLACVAPDVNG
jgi:hypothetical protein